MAYEPLKKKLLHPFEMENENSYQMVMQKNLVHIKNQEENKVYVEFLHGIIFIQITKLNCQRKLVW